LKWGVPCYTIEKSNIVLIHGFKEYCAILFVKGALLKDDEGILITQTANVQAARQIRFTNVREIIDMEPILTTYIRRDRRRKSRFGSEFKKISEFIIPEEV
jgi:uncharacterized protein YdeI (YjbR/CyaY-like superfamily)